jgi:type IV pilus assembly protein PilV
MRAERGITLVEVLVTLVILAIGLLGLVGLQARVQVLQIESYQRAQALMLLNDMAGRIANNRNNAAAYVTPGSGGAIAALGAGMTCPATSTTNRRDADVSDWCNALKGASEMQGGSNVGAMVGGRGCVESLNPGAEPTDNTIFLVTVAWQGLVPIAAPPAGVACGLNSYNGGAGSACEGDLCRRVVTTVVQISTLT